MRIRVPLLTLAIVASSVTAAGATVRINDSKGKPTTTTTVPVAALTVRAAAQAALSAGSVHAVWTSTYGNHTYTNTVDAGASGGIVSISSTVGKLHGQAMAIVTPALAYIQGDAFSLKNTFNFSTPNSKKYAGKWIAFSSQQDLYESISATGTFSSLLANLNLKAPFVSLKSSILNGVAVTGVQGTAASPTTSTGPSGQVVLVYIATATGLPVRVCPKAGGSYKWNLQFSKWGDPVNVVPPSGAISGSTISHLIVRPSSSS